MSSRYKSYCLAAVLAATTSSSVLAETGFYIGAQTGYSDIELSDFDDDLSVQGYAGYNFIDWLGVEAGYTDLGDFDVKDGNSSVGVEAVHLALVLNGKFGYGLNVIAKVGAYDADISPDIPNAAVKDTSETGYTYGAFLLKQFGSTFGVTGGWQYFNSVDEVDFNNYFVGVRLQF
jgi:hypothetical protein